MGKKYYRSYEDIEKNGEVELTDEMVTRLDEIHNAAQDFICTLLEEEIEWDFAVIGTVTDAVIEILQTEFDYKVRYPAVITEEDGSQFICEYCPDDCETEGENDGED